MKIAVLKEAAGETRCAAIPETVRKFAALGAEVAVEKGAGEAATTADSDVGVVTSVHPVHLATIAAGSYLTGRQIKLRLPLRAGRAPRPSVGKVDAGEPESGSVDLGRRG